MLLHSAGTSPCRAFLLPSTVTTDDREPHAAGSVPLSALRDTFSLFSLPRLPHTAGSGPVSALPASVTSVRRVRRHQLSGSDPLTIAPLPLSRTRVRGISDPSTSSLSSGRLPAAASATSSRSSVTVSSVLHTTPGHAQ
ncbi:hypothetical protein NESM_000891000 [Novymonas esmeraldas]|uniref:Uncharacterized protein n=1 Tax=Novymonas esmeraldas TaxID=1808958 RepID=A0AAW0EYK6_9TRYP